jgi:periplasmic protein TonB
MFEGFDPKSQRTDRRRFGMSLVVSFAVYVPIIGGIVAASAHAVHKVAEPEKQVDVQFKEPPPPPPPPPVEQPKPQKVVATKPARAKVERPELKAPDEIPDEKPPEADTALPEAAPIDQGQTGYLTGQIGGTGTGEVAPPPPPPKPKIVRSSDPVKDGNFKMPEYPRSARRAGITGTVIARIYVSAQGKVTRVEILEGPDVFHEYVKEALLAWHYTPARLSDGSATADTHIVRVPFVLN